MMCKLHLDYQRGMQFFRWMGVLLLVMSLVTLIATSVYYRDLSDRLALMEHKVVQMKRTAQRPLPYGRSGEHMAAGLAIEVKHANEVLRQLSMPWDGLFHTVESAGGKDVALLALEPDTEKRLLKISGEAKNIAAMLDYIRKLEKRDLFGTVYLQSHHVQMQDPEKPVRFVLLAIWRVRS
jgi:hypothetical protein